MNAKDLMTENPRTREPSDTLESVIRILKQEDCGIVPVIRGSLARATRRSQGGFSQTEVGRVIEKISEPRIRPD